MQIKLAAGAVALEYEGDEKFFSQEIPKFVELFLGQATKVSPLPPAEASRSSGSGPAGGKGDNFAPHSTNTVAKLLNVQTGPDLIMAAVVKKIMVDGDDNVSRQSIISEMKKASSYYKKTYVSNLSNYLDTLTKADNIRLASDGVYGLPAKMRDAIGPKLHEQ